MGKELCSMASMFETMSTVPGILGMKDRVPWEDYFLNIAMVIATRSTCLRRKYGAVIVKDNIIVSTGYNGAPKRTVHCLGNGCERERLNIPHGQQYEKCVAVHAEQNAIISGDPAKMKDANLYLFGFDMSTGKVIEAVPCEICRPMIRNAGIINIISKSADGKNILRYDEGAYGENVKERKLVL